MKRWTKKTPTTQGFYWHRENKDDLPTIVEVKMGFQGMVVWYFGNEIEVQIAEVGGQWKECQP